MIYKDNYSCAQIKNLLIIPSNTQPMSELFFLGSGHLLHLAGQVLLLLDLAYFFGNWTSSKKCQLQQWFHCGQPLWTLSIFNNRIEYYNLGNCVGNLGVKKVYNDAFLYRERILYSKQIQRICNINKPCISRHYYYCISICGTAVQQFIDFGIFLPSCYSYLEDNVVLTLTIILRP